MEKVHKILILFGKLYSYYFQSLIMFLVEDFMVVVHLYFIFYGVNVIVWWLFLWYYLGKFCFSFLLYNSIWTKPLLESMIQFWVSKRCWKNPPSTHFICIYYKIHNILILKITRISKLERKCPLFFFWRRRKLIWYLLSVLQTLKIKYNIRKLIKIFLSWKRYKVGDIKLKNKYTTKEIVEEKDREKKKMNPLQNGDKRKAAKWR